MFTLQQGRKYRFDLVIIVTENRSQWFNYICFSSRIHTSYARGLLLFSKHFFITFKTIFYGNSELLFGRVASFSRRVLYRIEAAAHQLAVAIFALWMVSSSF